MQIVHNLKAASPEHSSRQQSYVTIGVFDGLHLGHQRIMRGLVEQAHAHDQRAVAITFDPHPASVLSNSQPLLLTTVGERLDLMATLGLDAVVVYPFTDEIVQTTADEFVAELTRHLNLAEIRVGPDFTLGHGQQGDIPCLKRLGGLHGFEVRVIQPVSWGGGVVHSSRIRRALKQGRLEEAKGCLGRPYSLSGVVIRGRGLGRDIGVPTANMDPPPHRLIPLDGVYACRAYTERWGAYPAAVNIGTRPTFGAQDDAERPTVEAHLLEFDRGLYDQVLKLDFIVRLRDERPHPTLNALVAQLREDIAQTRRLLGE